MKNVDLFKNTGFDVINIPCSPDLLYTEYSNDKISFTDVNLIQTDWLGYITLELESEEARNIDYAIVTDEDTDERTCYIVDHYEMISDGVCKLYMLLDPYNTMGGFEEGSGNIVISGNANRLTVPLEHTNDGVYPQAEDNMFFTLEEPYQPGNRLITHYNSFNPTPAPPEPIVGGLWGSLALTNDLGMWSQDPDVVDGLTKYYNKNWSIQGAKPTGAQRLVMYYRNSGKKGGTYYNRASNRVWGCHIFTELNTDYYNFLNDSDAVKLINMDVIEGAGFLGSGGHMESHNYILSEAPSDPRNPGYKAPFFHTQIPSREESARTVWEAYNAMMTDYKNALKTINNQFNSYTWVHGETGTITSKDAIPESQRLIIASKIDAAIDYIFYTLHNSGTGPYDEYYFWYLLGFTLKADGTIDKMYLLETRNTDYDTYPWIIKEF